MSEKQALKIFSPMKKKFAGDLFKNLNPTKELKYTVTEFQSMPPLFHSISTQTHTKKPPPDLPNTATVCGPDKAPVFGGRNKRGKLLEPDPVIPVPCAFFDMDFALVPGYAFSCLENPSDMFRERQFDHGYGARAAKAGVKRVVAPGVLATCSGKAEPRLLQDIVREDYHSRGFFHALPLAMALYIKALFTSRSKDG